MRGDGAPVGTSVTELHLIRAINRCRPWLEVTGVPTYGIGANLCNKGWSLQVWRWVFRGAWPVITRRAEEQAARVAGWRA